MVNKPIPSNPKTVRANTRWETLYETAVILLNLYLLMWLAGWPTHLNFILVFT
jgi:hypothetical protein